MVGINKESQEISRDVSNEWIRSSQERSVHSEWQKTIGINGKRTYLKIQKMTHTENNGLGDPKTSLLNQTLLCILL